MLGHQQDFLSLTHQQLHPLKKCLSILQRKYSLDKQLFESFFQIFKTFVNRKAIATQSLPYSEEGTWKRDDKVPINLQQNADNRSTSCPELSVTLFMGKKSTIIFICSPVLMTEVVTEQYRISILYANQNLHFLNISMTFKFYCLSIEFWGKVCESKTH